MSLLCPTEGASVLLTKMLISALSTDENYTLRLFQNNHTPAYTDTSANYTACSFAGYSDTTLTRAGWGAVTINGSNQATTTYGTAQTWTCSSGSQTVYGYCVISATSGKVLWAELFATPRTLGASDSITCTPAVTFTNA